MNDPKASRDSEPANDELGSSLNHAFDAELARLDAAIVSEGPDSDAVTSAANKDPELRAAAETLQMLERSRRSSGSGELFGTVNSAAERSPALSELDIEVPDSFANFRIEGKIGHGGYGFVFRAFDPILRRHVALKIPRLHTLVTERMRERFVREGEAAAALSHPNIVPIFEAGKCGPVPYIASGWIDGISLEQWLITRNVPVKAGDAARLLIPLADAIQHAHSRGVFHRDLKPANILVQNSARAESALPSSSDLLITDFGLARLADDSDATHAGLIVGTPAYAAPEQARADITVPPELADVYSLGAVLVELLTGHSPCVSPAGAATTDVDFVARLNKPDIPPDLRAICVKCLKNTPAQRYSSAAALREDLTRFVTGIPVAARPVSGVVWLWRWARRHPALSLLGSSLLVLVLCFAIVAGLAAQRFHQQARELSASLSRAKTAEASARELVDMLGHQLMDAHHDQVIASWTKVVEEGRADADAWIRRGEAFWHKSEYERATSDFQKALDVESENPFAMDYLAWVHTFGPSELRDLDRALKLSRSAVARFDGWGTRQTLASIQFYRGEFHPALESMDIAIGQRPDGGSPLMLLIRSMIHHRLGDKQQAQTDFEYASGKLAGQTEIPWVELNRVHRQAVKMLSIDTND